MKKLLSVSQCLLFRNILKVAGVYGLLVMFETCYGSPKATFIQIQNIKYNPTEQAATKKHLLTPNNKI